MAGKQNSLIWSQADATAETSAESRHFVPETSPPDNVQRISGHLTRCEGQSRQSEVSSECAETERYRGERPSHVTPMLWLLIEEQPGNARVVLSKCLNECFSAVIQETACSSLRNLRQ